MYRIRLSNGTEYPVKFCATSGGIFTARLVTNESFLSIATEFSNELNTQTIEYLYDSTTDTFCGYTVLQSISITDSGDTIVILKAGE